MIEAASCEGICLKRLCFQRMAGSTDGKKPCAQAAPVKAAIPVPAAAVQGVLHLSCLFESQIHAGLISLTRSMRGKGALYFVLSFVNPC